MCSQKHGYNKVSLVISRSKLQMFLEAFNYASARAREDEKYHGFFFGRQVQEVITQISDVVYRRENETGKA